MRTQWQPGQAVRSPIQGPGLSVGRPGQAVGRPGQAVGRLRALAGGFAAGCPGPFEKVEFLASLAARGAQKRAKTSKTFKNGDSGQSVVRTQLTANPLVKLA